VYIEVCPKIWGRPVILKVGRALAEQVDFCVLCTLKSVQRFAFSEAQVVLQFCWAPLVVCSESSQVPKLALWIEIIWRAAVFENGFVFKLFGCIMFILDKVKQKNDVPKKKHPNIIS
jgi:hypothetical protein